MLGWVFETENLNKSKLFKIKLIMQLLIFSPLSVKPAFIEIMSTDLFTCQVKTALQRIASTDCKRLLFSIAFGDCWMILWFLILIKGEEKSKTRGKRKTIFKNLKEHLTFPFSTKSLNLFFAIPSNFTTWKENNFFGANCWELENMNTVKYVV